MLTLFICFYLITGIVDAIFIPAVSNWSSTPWPAFIMLCLLAPVVLPVLVLFWKCERLIHHIKVTYEK